MDTKERRTATRKAPQSVWQCWVAPGHMRRHTDALRAAMHRNKGLLLSIAVTVALSAFFAYAWLPAHRIAPPEVVGQFQTRSYPMGDHEHIAVFDVPNRVFPQRCWVYVNERIATSNMQCDPADDSGALPAQGGVLER